MTIPDSLINPMHDSENSNQEFWVPDEENLFVKAKLLKTIAKDKEYEVEIISSNGESKGVKKVDQILPSNASYFDNVDNLSQLPHLNEPSVLNNLQHRFRDGKIYTYSGLFLVAVNPYKHNEALYSNSMIQKYHSEGAKSMLSSLSSRYTVNSNEIKNKDLPPHVFAIAEEALNNLFAQQKDQSILVTGESGAGKTENTKKILQYLTNVLQNDLGGDSKKERINFENKILESNPILESFGNATTVKNNNSSRFGKFIKLFFNLETKRITKTYIDWYLLEKSRVTFIDSKNERNYHVFYQLLTGLSKNPKNPIFKDLNIDSLDYNHWKYLKTQKTNTGIDDSQEFNELLTAFSKIGFTEKEQNQVFKVLSAILHLGNIYENANISANSDKQALLSANDLKHLKIIANLLGIDDIKEFEISLTSPKVTAGKEKVKQKRTYRQSKAIIDSLAKIIYEKLFGYIVSKVNDSLKQNSDLEQSESLSSSNFIGLLDIAGFEIFDKNSLEQLLINYTNENLQQFFNHHMFVLEQEEYMKENITWNFKDYGLDLQHTIDLLSSKPTGILPLLDEETIMPNSNDEKFYDRLLTTVASNSRFQRVKVSKKNTSKSEQPKLNNFIVKHYAGDVEYDSADWLHKNKEPLNEHLQQILFSSKNDLLKDYLFVTKDNTTSFKTQSQRHSHQLSSLIANLKYGNPHFIRCILPNTTKSSSIFDKKLVLDQLTCNGVLEGIRISREGFPNRIPFAQFVKTYSILLDKDFDGRGSSSKENTEKIMNSISVLSSKNDDYKIGKQKILFKSGKLAIVEELKQAKLNDIIGQFIANIKGKALRFNLKQDLNRIKSSKLLNDAFEFYDTRLLSNGWFKLFTAVKPLLEDTVDGNDQNSNNKKLADILFKNQELVDMVNALETKLGKVKENSSKISDINLQLEKDILKSQDENKSLLGNLSKIELSFKQKDDEINQLNVTHKDFEQKIQELNIQAETLTKKEAELNSSIDTISTEKAILEKDLDHKSELILLHQKDIDSLKQSKLELDILITTLKTEIEEKNKEIQTLGSDLKKNDKTISSKLNSLEDNFNKANNKVKVLVEENRITKSDLSKLKQEKLQLESKYLAACNQLDKSELKVKQLEKEIKDLQNLKKINHDQQESKYSQQIAQLLSEKEALQSSYAELQSEYQTIEMNYKKNELKLKQLTNGDSTGSSSGELNMLIKKLQTQLYQEKLNTDYLHQKTLSLPSNEVASDVNPKLVMAELMDLKEILRREQKEKHDTLSRIKFLRTKLAGANMDNEELSHKVSKLLNILHENKISLENIDAREYSVENEISLLKKQLNKSVLEYDQLKEKLDKQVILKEENENQKNLLINKLGLLMSNKENDQNIDFASSIKSVPITASDTHNTLALKEQIVDLKDALDITGTNLLKAEQKIIELNQSQSSLKMTIISIQKDLEASNKQNELYSQSILDYKHDYQSISEESLQLESKLKQSQLRINEQNEKLFKMETILEDQKNELNDLRKANISKEDLIVDLEDSVSSKEIELEKLQQLNQLLREDLEHMRITLKDFSRDSDLITKIEILNGKLSKMSRNEIDLNKKISNLEYELSTLEKEHTLQLTELETQNAHYLQQNKSLLDGNQDLKNKILDLTETITINKNEIDKLNEMIDAGIVERNSLVKERESLMDSLDAKDSDIENYISDLTILKKQNEEIVEKLGLKDKSLRRHEELIARLNSENDGLQSAIDDLKENLIDVEKENKGLFRENEDFKEHIRDITSQLGGRSFERDSWNGKLAEMNTRLSNETNLKFEQLKENKKLSNELDEVSVQLDKCLNKLETLDNTNKDLNASLQSKDGVIKNLHAELLQEQNQNKKNQSLNMSLEKKLMSMEQELELWKSRYYTKTRD